MKMPEQNNPITEEGFELRFKTRPSSPTTLSIPDDVLSAMQQVASSRDMTVDALIKLYIGQGLRQDMAKLFSERVLEKTAEVLTRHIQSEEQVSAILKEIRVEATA